MDRIPIYIPDEEAKQFLLFQKHYDLFNLLLERGIFDQKKSIISLYFDHTGTLTKIQRDDNLYDYMHPDFKKPK